jgi:hypothetical protein
VRSFCPILIFVPLVKHLWPKLGAYPLSVIIRGLHLSKQPLAPNSVKVGVTKSEKHIILQPSRLNKCSKRLLLQSVIVSNPQVKQAFSSIRFIQWNCLIKSVEY